MMKSTLCRARLRASSSSPLASNYPCLRCRTHLLPRSSRTPSLLPRLTQRHASNEAQNATVSAIRKKIWGTEHPPGQRDPYQQLTPEEREKEEQAAAAERDLEVKKQAEADVIAEAQAEYVPATTWEGLERIGGPTGWWEEAWDRENVFEGYLTQAKISHGEAASTAKRVLVELLALRDAGRPLSDASKAPAYSEVDYEGIDITVPSDGQAQLSYKDPVIQGELIDSLEPEEGASAEVALNEQPVDEVGTEGDVTSNEQVIDEVVTEEDDISYIEYLDSQLQQSEGSLERLKRQIGSILLARSENSKEEINVETAPWLKFPLTDLQFRFAFIKRLMGVSGIRIHDPKIANFGTIGDVVAHLSEKPKPKRLAEILLSNPEHMALPNVEIFERRHTPIDKEKEIGRWKVIEAELLRRGLPVTGHRVR